MDIYKKSITELSELLNKKTLSSKEMTNYFLKIVEQTENIDLSKNYLFMNILY